MRLSPALIVSYVCLALAGCSTIHSTRPATTPVPVAKTTSVNAKCKCHKKTNPLAVSLYPRAIDLNVRYTVLGEAKVSRYNMGGLKRQDAIIHDVMRTVAASMGGDAIVDIKGTGDMVSGKVIKYG